MKAVKLAIIFVCCVIVLVAVMYIPRLLKGNNSNNPTPPPAENVVGKDNLDEGIKSGVKFNDNDDNQTPKYEARESIDNASLEENETPQQVDQTDSEDDAMAKHIAQKKETERKLLALLNSGKYEESEQMCKSEWSLNKYYVDVKYIRKVLTSEDKNLKKNLTNDGVIDSTGKLTEEYKLKSVNGIASLKSTLKTY